MVIFFWMPRVYVQNPEVISCHKVVCRGINFRKCGQILTLGDIIYNNKELQLCLGQTGPKYWEVDKYCLAINLSWMIFYINVKLVLFLFKFLSNNRIGIKVNWGQRTIIFEVLKKLKVRLNCRFLA